VEIPICPIYQGTKKEKFNILFYRKNTKTQKKLF